MSIGRRKFILGTLSTAAVSKLLGGCDSSQDGTGTPDDGALNPALLPVDQALFAHGVASGDPRVDSVILWTRASVADNQPIELEWALAKDAAFLQVVDRGTATARPEQDFTIKIDPNRLEPGTTYYYLFFAGERGRSTIGRTRTLPASIDRARIAFTSCANYQNGYFTAYRALAQRSDLDVWIHLGDYVYEYKDSYYGDESLYAARPLVPAHEIVSLADYRARYANYRTDPDLQEVHRQHPLIAVWDDHEFANNAFLDGAENHMEASEGSWTARKRAAAQAFLEWLPIRVELPAGDAVPNIYRTFSFGDLFDLVMLDTRIVARARQAGDDLSVSEGGTGVGNPADWRDPNRQLLGSEQESWFLSELMRSSGRGARWRLIGNQVIISPARDPLTPVASDQMTRNILFADFWDGYQAARDRVLDQIAGLKDVVFLTGDIHSSWAFEVSKNPYDAAVYDPSSGSGSVAIELVGPSVTSLALENDPSRAELAAMLLPGMNNPHLKYVEFTRKGYVLVDLTAERLQAEWWFVTQFKAPEDGTEALGKAFTCQQGSARLVETSTASLAKDVPPALAPA